MTGVRLTRNLKCKMLFNNDLSLQTLTQVISTLQKISFAPVKLIFVSYASLCLYSDFLFT